MEKVLAKTLYSSELPGARNSNQAGIAIVAESVGSQRKKECAVFFNTTTAGKTKNLKDTKFFLDDVEIADGEINVSWQHRQGNQTLHIQLYRWQGYFKEFNLQPSNSIVLIRDVSDEDFDFYFYIYTRNHLVFNQLRRVIPDKGAHFLSYSFGLSDPKPKLINTPTEQAIIENKAQGRISVANERQAIEKRAEAVTREELEKRDFKFQFSLGKPYDLNFIKNHCEYRIEVKGTKNKQKVEKVNVTVGELLHARGEHVNAFPKDLSCKIKLCVVNNIKTMNQSGQWLATGGEIIHFDNFFVLDNINLMFLGSNIEPKTFTYKILSHKLDYEN
jgi:hypothetical protein